MTENKLDYKELKEQHPKAIKLLVEWTKKNLENFQRVMMSQIDVKEDVKIPEITQEHAEKATESLLYSYYRSLYDLFDQNEVYISIQETGAGDWQYDVGEGWSSPYKTRIDAEMKGMKRAFEELEVLLK